MRIAKSGLELIEICKEHHISLSEYAIAREIEDKGVTREDLFAHMQLTLDAMREGATLGREKEVYSLSGLIGGDAYRLEQYLKSGKSLMGEGVVKAMAMALSSAEVNGSMGKIVACPTAGSCGILPGAIVTIGKEYGIDDETMIDALFTASAIGAIITRNATVSGAEGGCQAETGAAAAMASAGVVEMMGGSPEQAVHAASHCLQNVMGLVCDPIAGLVEVPCQGRNAIGVANALISAELCLAGILNIIPFDETVAAMYKVGKTLPMELRETALGGVAATCTGCSLTNKIFG